MSVAMRWGLSVLEWRSRASNEHAEHPIGVLRAECEHLLIMVTTLHEKPYGDPCEVCAALRFDRAMAEVPGRSRPPRSGDGEPDLPPWVVYVSDCGHRRVMSNPAHIGPCPGCGATGARSPRPYFDRLVAAVERLNAARSLSRQLRVLAEEAPTVAVAPVWSLLASSGVGYAVVCEWGR